MLEAVDFAVEPGRCVAFVGATGAGKSTLLGLVPRFSDPRAGRVLVDGVDVRALDLDTLRRNVGVVFQESLLFRGTVADNIAFGHPDATRDAIERAARTAGAHEFIAELPARLRHLHRGGGAQPVGRAAPAAGDRARDPARAADPAARRSDQRDRRAHRGRGAVRHRGRAPRAHDAARHQPLLGPARRRRDLRARRGPHRRARHARGAGRRRAACTRARRRCTAWGATRDRPAAAGPGHHPPAVRLHAPLRPHPEHAVGDRRPARDPASAS